MQLKLIISAALLSASSLVSAANTITITSISPAQSSRVINDISAYATSLFGQAQYKSAASVVRTAVPAAVLNSIANDEGDFVQSFATATALPAWYLNLPQDVQSYISSIGAAEASIVNKDLAAAAPRVGTAVKLAGVAAAAGIAAIVML